MSPHAIEIVVTSWLAVGTFAGAGPTTDRMPAVAQASDVSPPVRSFPGALAATFAGDLPCADCPGIRHTVDLHADGTFVYRLTYLGAAATRGWGTTRSRRTRSLPAPSP